jgi:hypothetical protein
MIWRARRHSLSAPPNPVVNKDDPPPRRDNLHATAHATGMAIGRASNFPDCGSFRIIAGKDRNYGGEIPSPVVPELGAATARANMKI